MMMVLSIARLPLFGDFTHMYKWKEHFNELNKLNITDLLFKVEYKRLRFRIYVEMLLKIVFYIKFEYCVFFSLSCTKLFVIFNLGAFTRSIGLFAYTFFY